MVASAVMMISAWYLDSQYIHSLIAIIEILHQLILDLPYDNYVVYAAMIGHIVLKTMGTSNRTDQKEPQESEKRNKNPPLMEEKDPYSRATSDIPGPLVHDVPNPTAITWFTAVGSRKASLVPIFSKDVGNDDEFCKRWKNSIARLH